MNFFRRLKNNSDGATAIEYGLLAALIAVGIISSVAGIGSSLNQTFSKTSSGMSNA